MTAPQDEQELRAEIEQTREDLGRAVEQLAAKADVKGLARARAARLAGQARSMAAQVRAKAASTAEDERAPLVAAAVAVVAAFLAVLLWRKP